jgi:hypothetical protein
MSGFISMIFLYLMALAIVLFLVWLARSRRNAQELSPGASLPSRGWTMARGSYQWSTSSSQANSSSTSGAPAALLGLLIERITALQSAALGATSQVAPLAQA